MEEEQNNRSQNQTTNPYKLIRSSIHTFLTHFHLFTSSPTLFSLPFSLVLLLLHPTAASFSLHRRLAAVLLAGGVPLTSPTSQFLLLKLSQTLSSSISTLPFSLSFLLLSKSATISFLRHRRPSISSFPCLLITQLCSLFVLLSLNSAFLNILCFSPTFTYPIIAVLYSVFLANAVVTCNLGLISSGWEGVGGFTAIIRAFGLIRGKRTLTALAIALPGNLAMAGTEWVFRYRMFGSGERWIWGVAVEMVLIAFVYSVLIVGDTIVGCLFYQRCKEELGLICCESEIEDEEEEEEEDAFPQLHSKPFSLGRAAGIADHSEHKRFVREVHEEASEAREKASELKLRRQEQALARREKLKQAYLRKRLQNLKGTSKAEQT